MLPILLNLGYGKSNLEKKIETEGQNRREGEKQYFPASCFEVQSAASENQPWTIAHSKVP